MTLEQHEAMQTCEWLSSLERQDLQLLSWDDIDSAIDGLYAEEFSDEEKNTIDK